MAQATPSTNTEYSERARRQARDVRRAPAGGSSAVAHRGQQAPVEQRWRRPASASAPRRGHQHRRRQHRQRVEQQEAGAHAAGHVDERRDDQQVAQQLGVARAPRRERHEAQRDHVHDRQRVGRADHEVQRVDGEQRLGDRLDVGGDEEQGGHHHHPEHHQPLEARLQVGVHAPAGLAGACRPGAVVPPRGGGLRALRTAC